MFFFFLKCVFVSRPGALLATELQQWFGEAQGGSELLVPPPLDPVLMELK